MNAGLRVWWWRAQAPAQIPGLFRRGEGAFGRLFGFLRGIEPVVQIARWWTDLDKAGQEGWPLDVEARELVPIRGAIEAGRRRGGSSECAAALGGPLVADAVLRAFTSGRVCLRLLAGYSGPARVSRACAPVREFMALVWRSRDIGRVLSACFVVDLAALYAGLQRGLDLGSNSASVRRHFGGAAQDGGPAGVFFGFPVPALSATSLVDTVAAGADRQLIRSSTFRGAGF